MFHKSMKLTTSQFAKIHHLNKRTLHYYDEIGLFSPLYKDSHNYRYYDLSQSIELEYILLLKELHMSLEEIKNYLISPNANDFMHIADAKIDYIDQEVKRLKETKLVLMKRKQMLEMSRQIKDGDIWIGEHQQDYVFMTDTLFDDDFKMISLLKEHKNIEPYLQGFGSYISVDKIINHNFDAYDGFFIPTKKRQTNKIKRPSGQYIYAYSIGDWNKLPQLYQKILSYTDKHHLKLTGYAYETGLNEIAMKDMDEYVTQIMIQIQSDVL